MSELKTTPNIGTYFPTKVPVKDDEMHYLVPVMKWHNTEHDAQLAHQFLAALARKDAALRMAVEALEHLETIDGYSEGKKLKALAACREAMGETP